MGTGMEVVELESRMDIEDYRKLQSLFMVGSCEKLEMAPAGCSVLDNV